MSLTLITLTYPQTKTTTTFEPSVESSANIKTDLLTNSPHKQPQTKMSTPQPSTPPFLNIQSPDLKSFSSFVRSPAPQSSLSMEASGLKHPDHLFKSTATPPSHLYDPPLDNLMGNALSPGTFFNTNLSDMDFESAYALLTKSPNPNSSGSFQPHSFNSPRGNILSPGLNIFNDTFPSSAGGSSSLNPPLPPQSNDLKEYLFLSNSPSPRITTPKLATPSIFKPAPLLPNDIPNSNALDIDTLMNFFPKGQDGDQLLSVNESNALDQFLDSIIDEKKDTHKPHTHNIHQEPIHGQTNNTGFHFQDLIKEHIGSVTPSIQERCTSSLTLSEIHPLVKREGIESPPPPIIKLNSPLPIPSPIQQHSTASLPPPTLPKLIQAPIVIHSNSTEPEAKIKKPRRKRKNLLTEHQKKQNHISSEQRRRQLIKATFDQLVRLLSEKEVNCKSKSKKKKAMAKSDVLEATRLEIEKLVRINQELREYLGEKK